MNESTQTAEAAGGHDADHPPHLAHHFSSAQQQFTAGKLGMWIFLATEVLMFGGLFCAYAIYRARNPEIFEWGHAYLDKGLGAINTVVLIASSFTVAWAVRCAQLNRKVALCVLLALTIAGGITFMGIKYVEYRAKWKAGLMAGRMFDPDPEYLAAHYPAAGHAPAAHADDADHAPSDAQSVQADWPAAPVVSGEAASRWDGLQPHISKPGLTVMTASSPAPPTDASQSEDIPKFARVFFSIYFGMTGLHGLHVLVGIVLLTVLLIMSLKGRFSSSYFTPIDLGALYWHLVDLIWIYLFPLLYLIE